MSYNQFILYNTWPTTKLKGCFSFFVLSCYIRMWVTDRTKLIKLSILSTPLVTIKYKHLQLKYSRVARYNSLNSQNNHPPFSLSTPLNHSSSNLIPFLHFQKKHYKHIVIFHIVVTKFQTIIHLANKRPRRLKMLLLCSVWGKAEEIKSIPTSPHLASMVPCYGVAALTDRKLWKLVSSSRYIHAPRLHAILIEQPRWKAPLTFGVGNAMDSRFNENRGANEGNPGVRKNLDWGRWRKFFSRSILRFSDTVNV